MYTLYNLTRGYDMANCKLLGITGPAQSGKSTLCKELENIASFYGTTVDTFAFADPLKEICAKLFGTAYGVPPAAWTTEKSRIYPYVSSSGRKMMQYMGDAVKMYFPALILDYTIKRVMESEADLVIVSDVRFLEEAKGIRDLGGAVVKVTSPYKPMTHKEQDMLNHVSETEMASIEGDYVIHNDRSFEHLSNEAKKLLCEMEFLPST